MSHYTSATILNININNNNNNNNSYIDIYFALYHECYFNMYLYLIITWLVHIDIYV